MPAGFPTRPRIATADDVKLFGGSPSLDFVNTVLWRGTSRAQDVLIDYAALLRWSLRVGLVDPRHAGALERLADASPRSAATAHRRAVAVREGLHRAFRAVIEGQSPAPSDLDRLKHEFAESLPPARLTPDDGTLRWTWQDREQALERPLWPLAHDALGLLLSDDATRLRRCAADECGWLFVDDSKNRSRRWCSMEGCGSRAKMRRHYARSRARQR